MVSLRQPIHSRTAARGATLRGVNQRTFEEVQYWQCNIRSLVRGDTSRRLDWMPQRLNV